MKTAALLTIISIPFLLFAMFYIGGGPPAPGIWRPSPPLVSLALGVPFFVAAAVRAGYVLVMRSGD